MSYYHISLCRCEMICTYNKYITVVSIMLKISYSFIMLMSATKNNSCKKAMKLCTSSIKKIQKKVLIKKCPVATMQ